MELKDKALSWWQNLKPAHAIIIGSVFIAVSPIIGAYYLKQSAWVALGAIGTFLAVVVAIHRDFILKWLTRPILEVTLLEPSPPHLRKVRTSIYEESIDPQTGQKIVTVKDVPGYHLSLQLKNTGRTISKKTQPLITKMGQYFYEDGWKTQNNWIPTPLSWVLDELASKAKGMPTEEKDLVPGRPYVFNLGGILENRPDFFLIYPTVIPRNQPNKYIPGRYCFEIAVYALEAKRITRYVEIEWREEDFDNPVEIPNRLIVSLRDRPPWKKS